MNDYPERRSCLSEPNTEEMKYQGPPFPADLAQELAQAAGKDQLGDAERSPPNIDLESLFDHGSMIDQVQLQVSLLTAAMTKNMILATGPAPDLTEGPLPETPGYAIRYAKPEPAERATSWTAARSLQLRDAARLSFATASLVGAFAKLEGLSGQRFTTRHTIIADPNGKKKPRKITTVTHHLMASKDDRAVPAPGSQPDDERTEARVTQQG